MTITSTLSKITYHGNGTTRVWPFPFKVRTETEIAVLRTDSSGREQIIPAGYTITGLDQDSGGSVTYPVEGAPLPAGERLTLRRTVPRIQDLDLQNQGGFFPDVIESQFDRLVMMVQEVEEKADRAVKVALSSDIGPDALIADLTTRANDAIAAAANAQSARSAADASRVAAEGAAATISLPPLAADALIQAGTDGAAWEAHSPATVRATLDVYTRNEVDAIVAESGVSACREAIARLEGNIALLSLRSQIDAGWSILRMIQGAADEFEDESGISSSVGLTYNAAGDYYHNPGAVTTTSDASKWTGAIASTTFSSDDLAIGTVNRSIYITEGFPDDFSVTFKAIAGSGGGDAFCAFLFRDGARGSFNSTWPNGAMSGVGASLARILMGQVGGTFNVQDGANGATGESTACASGDTFVVSRSGTTVTFSKNGTAFASWTGVSETLFFGFGTGSANLDADDISWTVSSALIEAATGHKVYSSSQDWGTRLSGRKHVGERFRASTSAPVSRVSVAIPSVMSGGVPTARARIHTDNAGSPGTQVGGDSVAVAITAAGTKTFTWSDNVPTLTAGTLYWVVLSDEGANGGSASVLQCADLSGDYAGGWADTITSIAEDSGSPDANRDFIISVILAGSSGGIGTLTSIAHDAGMTPEEARFIVLHQPINAAVLNTDVILEASRDGLTWTAGELVNEGVFDSVTNILSAVVDLSGQPTGALVKWRLRIPNAVEQRVHGVWTQWR